MSEQEILVSLPLDDEGFFRRECPYCIRQFKMEITEKELGNEVEALVESYLTETSSDSGERETVIETESESYYCPYCGQEASSDKWWTADQLAYVEGICKNIAIKAINEQLIAPMKKNFGHSKSDLISISIDANELKEEEPKKPLEVNDMRIFTLPCCSARIKVEESYRGSIHCIKCGFSHPET